MRGIVTKMFIQSREEQTFGKPVYRLGAVCRGDDNKDWAATTPSGSVQISNTPLLDELFARQERELLLIWRPDVAGEWELKGCNFTYGGCEIKFARSQPWHEATYSINAKAATEGLRKVYADSLVAGVPSKWALLVTKIPVPAAMPEAV